MLVYCYNSVIVRTTQSQERSANRVSLGAGPLCVWPIGMLSYCIVNVVC